MARDCILLQNFQNGPVVHVELELELERLSFPEVRRPGLMSEVDHSPSYSAEIKKEWN